MKFSFSQVVSLNSLKGRWTLSWLITVTELYYPWNNMSINNEIVNWVIGLALRKWNNVCIWLDLERKITLTNDLSWHEHITNIAISANKLLDIFNAFKYKLDRRTLEKLYFSYVRSKLEYSSILCTNGLIWLNALCPNYLSNNRRRTLVVWHR